MKSLKIVNRYIKAIKKLLRNLKDTQEGTLEDFDKFCNEQELKHLEQIKQDLERLQKQDDDIKSGELSDGYHTFNDLYYQRVILFATLVNQNKKTSWKSYKHEDGELCFGGGWFIVGIDTPLGSYTYHYENKYWDLFQCKELEKGKHWDGHTSKDVDRLLSIKNEDLEILEMLKSKLLLNHYPKEGSLRELYILVFVKRTNKELSCEVTKEEYNKLKQWVEEDKNVI